MINVPQWCYQIFQDGVTALIRVSEEGSLGTMKVLLDHGADINAGDWVR